MIHQQLIDTLATDATSYATTETAYAEMWAQDAAARYRGKARSRPNSRRTRR